MKARLLAVCCGGLLVASLLRAQDVDFGAAEISSDPSGAAVYVEGFLLGSTPVSISRLSAERTFRVVIKKKGYNDIAEDLRVTAGEIERVSLNLTPGSRRSDVREDDDWSPLLKGQDRTESSQARVKLRSYPTLVVANFLMKSDKELPPNALYALLPHLADRLDAKTSFEKFVTNYTDGPSARWMEESGAQGGPALVLSGVITRFGAAGSTRRLLLGTGTTSEVHCLFRVTDRATGEILLERSVKGRPSWRYAGGKNAVKNMAANIVEVLKKSW